MEQSAFHQLRTPAGKQAICYTPSRSVQDLEASDRMQGLLERLEEALSLCRAAAAESDRADAEALHSVIKEIECAISLVKSDQLSLHRSLRDGG